MGPAAGPPLPGRLLWRTLFLLAAADCCVWAVGTRFWPGQFFALLHAPDVPEGQPQDRLVLLQVLGLLALAHALVLVILSCWPEELGPLALVPLTGRLIGAAVWLWLLGSDRFDVPDKATPLLGLIVHEAVWVPGFVWFLFAWRRWRRQAAVRVVGHVCNVPEKEAR
jgi:hypothetical protein